MKPARGCAVCRQTLLGRLLYAVPFAFFGLLALSGVFVDTDLVLPRLTARRIRRGKQESSLQIDMDVNGQWEKTVAGLSGEALRLRGARKLLYGGATYDRAVGEIPQFAKVTIEQCPKTEFGWAVYSVESPDGPFRLRTKRRAMELFALTLGWQRAYALAPTE